jgi:hypothetical protein
LEARLTAAERLLAEREGTIDDLRRRLDDEAQERRRLTALLTDQTPKPEPLPPIPTATPEPLPTVPVIQGWRARLRFLTTGKA